MARLVLAARPERMLEHAARRRWLNARTLKLIAVSYAVKTVLVGLAWLAVPDLPQRASQTARQAWQRVAGTAPAAAIPAR
jgi:hypothetical protein